MLHCTFLSKMWQKRRRLGFPVYGRHHAQFGPSHHCAHFTSLEIVRCHFEIRQGPCSDQSQATQEQITISGQESSCVTTSCRENYSLPRSPKSSTQITHILTLQTINSRHFSLLCTYTNIHHTFIQSRYLSSQRFSVAFLYLHERSISSLFPQSRADP